MEDFSAIPVFVAVVENGGFSAAAETMHLSKSAVSKRVSMLEARLGVQLLHRTTRSISLTEAGERYYGHACACLAAAREAEDAVTRLQGQPQGRLRINAPMSFGRLHLSPLMADFLETYPDIRVDLVLEDRRVDLVEGGFDVAIRAGSLQDSSLIARRLAPCRNALVAAPDYLAREGMPKSPQGLVDHNCLSYAYFSGQHEWILIGAAGPEKIQVDGRYQVNNSEALREAVLGGVGIARIPTFIIGRDLRAGRLVEVMPEYRLPDQAVYAVFPERRNLPAKVRVFLDFVVERLGGEQPFWDRE